MARIKKKNPFVTFYGKHKISPVHQDISDFNLHLMRREKLYRLLGLPKIAFNGKNVLEVGPGGGFNALAFFAWGAYVDFVEPNKKAQDELPKLFLEYKIKKNRWNLFPRTIEEISLASRYDIVIAEGFIPGLYERDVVIQKLKQCVVPGGVVVVTCIDEIGFLLELLKRVVGQRLIWLERAVTFEDKVFLLSKAFTSHLKSLKCASRPVEDWVADQFLNPALYGNFFNMAECLNEFGRDFELLGSSPDMFVDYSWYKDVAFDRHASILEQYATKRHMFLWQGMKESIQPVESNEVLAMKAFELRMACKKAESSLDDRNCKNVVELFKKISDLVCVFDEGAGERLNQGIKLLENRNLSAEKVSQSDKFAASFGRGQQYVSLIKKTVFS